MATPSKLKTASVIEPGAHVRSLSAVYRPFGIGRVQKVRDHQGKVEYNPTVFSKPPHRSVNYIQALTELEICPTPLALAKAGHWGEAWKFEMRQMAARFLTLNKGGQLSNARTEILPHQIFTAYTVVSNPRRRFMLADEVGLGKTIEAGMVWQALEQRGNAAIDNGCRSGLLSRNRPGGPARQTAAGLIVRSFHCRERRYKTHPR